MGEAGLRYLLLSRRCLIRYYNKLIGCFSNLLPTVGGSEQNKSLQAAKCPHLTVLRDRDPLCAHLDLQGHSRGMTVISLLYTAHNV